MRLGLAFVCLLALGIAVLGGFRASSVLLRSRAVSRQPATNLRPVEAYGKLPLNFERNDGQADPKVKFLARAGGYTVFLTSSEAVLGLNTPNAKGPNATVRMKLVGANPQAEIAGLEQQFGKANYFIGNDPAKWQTDVPLYSKVRYADVYPGIDLVYYGNQQQLEYDFVVAPGADPNLIRLAFDGADKLAHDTSGDLVIHTGNSAVRLRKPVVYQESRGERHSIPAMYAQPAADEVAFSLGAYDPTKPLVMDPMLSYSGALNNANARAIVVDGSGNAYVTGDAAAGLNTTTGAFLTSSQRTTMFVAKIRADGAALVYSTYIGSSATATNGSSGGAIAIDGAGDAFIAGTSAMGFPTTPGVFQPSVPTNQSAAVALELNPSGSNLLYSTFLGTQSQGLGIAIDASGNAYVTGSTTSSGFPALSPIQAGLAGSSDAFVLKLNNSATGFVYSTFLGGPGGDVGNGIAVDADGNAYVTGTAGPNFPTTAGAFQTLLPNGGAFAAKLNPSGTALVYSTYVGGISAGNGTEAHALALSPSGELSITGETNAPDFPVTANAFQRVLASAFCDTGNRLCSDAFIARLDGRGSSLIYSTLFGGTGMDESNAIALDSGGNIYIAGDTRSGPNCNFPLVNPLQPVPSFGGFGGCASNLQSARSAFIAKFDADGALLFSTFLGGQLDSGAAGAPDRASGIAVDSSQNIYVSGYTNSQTFPFTTGAFRTMFQSVAGFIAKLTLTANPQPIIDSLSMNNIGPTTAPFDLWVNGAGFFTGSVVTWNGSPRPTNVNSLNQLFAAFTSADASVAQTAQIAVINPAPGGGTSNSLPFVVHVNPAPVITSLQPARAALGGAGFLLTVNGSSFLNGAMVLWNGVARPTTFVNGGQLTVLVAASDLAHDATTQITAINPPPGGGPSNAAIFIIGNPIPAITSGGTVNAASFAPGAPVAAGSIAALFGNNLQSLNPGDTSLKLNGVNAPLYAVSPGQINFQVPWELAGQSQATAVVSVAGVASGPSQVNLAALAPGIFTTSSSGNGQGSILIAGTTFYAAPTGAFPGSRPVTHGEYISVYCTGLGPVSGQPGTGIPAPISPLSQTTNAVTVSIGGVSVPASFAGLAPTFFGLYQVNAQVPASAPGGSAIPVTVSVGGAVSNAVIIAVQ